MKRKLDHDDKPVDASKVEASVSTSVFNTFGLDTRILQGIAKEKFFKPTLVQEKAIPLALEGKDILARAKTGSGKTAAYLLPIIQSILRKKPFSDKSTTALILVPTRELADQVLRAIESLTSFCTRDVRAINLTQKVSDAVQRSLLADFPDIVITTPARAALNVNNGALSLEKLGHLVIDEADLVLSYGYEDDLQTISQSTPQGIQTFLMSATLTTEVDTLKGLFCRNPVTLRLEEAEDDGSGLSQYMVKCAEDEKFLLLYVIFKLKLIKGKCIIFVADIDRCYRLKLFLEQFGIKSCVLNSELPVNSRLHIVQEFNKNVYDIIIATDENEVVGDEEDEAKEAIPVEEEEKTGEEMSKKRRKDELDPADPAEKGNENGTITKKKKKAPKRDREYGVSRGIDFRAVSCVVNFDLPASSKSYTHRIGRTARAGRSGMALSFVIPSELYRKHKATSHTCAANDEATLAKITKSQAKKGHEIKPYAFDMQAVEGFRYRMNDALRAVTGIAIRAARTRELRQELLKSEKLRRHFEENPEDLKGLRHDSELRSARIQPHLKHVPEYLLPQGGKNAVAKDVGFVGIGRTSENRIRKARARNKFRGKKATSKKADPLKTFNAKERGK